MAYAPVKAGQHVATVAGFFLAVLAFQPLLALALLLAALLTLFVAGKSGMEPYSSHDLTTPEGRRAAYLEELLQGDQHAKEIRLRPRPEAPRPGARSPPERRRRAGEPKALVEVNGAGETTLVKLLARLYDPQEGRITLDGVDIREFAPTEYRSRLAVVLQDFERYQLSARENVAFGRADLPPGYSRLRRSAAAAGALGLVEGLPEGWETLLGRRFRDRGQDLSGGQWQRIALARALYRDSPIVLLDEPTAALDAETEAEIFERYRDLTRGRLALLITHRFNTVRFADRIIVLESGRVVEDGTHGTLCRLGGRYAALFKTQAAAYRAEG